MLRATPNNFDGHSVVARINGAHYIAIQAGRSIIRSMSETQITPTTTRRSLSGNAIFGLVVAVLAIFLCLLPIVGIIAGVIGAGISGAGLWQISRGDRYGKGIAATGIVLGSVAAFVSLLLTLMAIQS